MHIDLSLLVCSPNGCNRQGWARPGPGDSSDLPEGTLAGNWNRGIPGTEMARRHPKQWLAPLHQKATLNSPLNSISMKLLSFDLQWKMSSLQGGPCAASSWTFLGVFSWNFR